MRRDPIMRVAFSPDARFMGVFDQEQDLWKVGQIEMTGTVYDINVPTDWTQFEPAGDDRVADALEDIGTSLAAVDGQLKYWRDRKGIDDLVDADRVQLPHGGTVHDLRYAVARTAARGSAVFARTMRDRNPGVAGLEMQEMAHGAAYHGWAVVALLRHIAEAHGPAAVHAAAAIVQSVGVDGDTGLCDDMPTDEHEYSLGQRR